MCDETIVAHPELHSARDSRAPCRWAARPAWGPAEPIGSAEMVGEVGGGLHGIDADDHGYGSASEQRLYQLVRERGAVVEHTFEIAFLDPAIAAYVFTFG
jgi:Thioredoxin like C-terminal domain